MARGAISVREAGRRGGLARIRKASPTQLSQSGKHAAKRAMGSAACATQESREASVTSIFVGERLIRHNT
jgi:hypothetical protein